LSEGERGLPRGGKGPVKERRGGPTHERGRKEEEHQLVDNVGEEREERKEAGRKLFNKKKMQDLLQHRGK